jgi:hypothetical protein
MRFLVTPCLMHLYDSAVILFQSPLCVKRVDTLVLDIKVECSDYVVFPRVCSARDCESVRSGGVCADASGGIFHQRIAG